MTYEPVLIAGCDDPSSHRLETYEKRGGYEMARQKIGSMEPSALVDLVKESGLRGRGGAGFPCGLKWSFLPKDSDAPVYLVINADESEPGTFKDRYLLEENPHLLIEGCLLTCWAIGAHATYIYLRGEFPLATATLDAAIEEARARGYVGKGIFGTDFDCEIHTARGAGAYICGEETGLLESLEGKRGHPRNKPPFPAVSGLFDCPTIINNVETIMNVPPLLERGLSWYQSLGREKNYGPKVWCVSGHVKRPGIYETALGITIEELLEEHCGGCRDGHRFKAAVPGGCSCGIVRADEFEAMLDFDALRDYGSSLGTGGVMAWDETTCIPDALLNFTEFYAEESCGQCTPCRQGTSWAAEILQRLRDGESMDGDIEEVRRIARGFTGTTICALADAAAIPIHSYIEKFPEEFEHHLRTGRCDVAEPATAGAAAGSAARRGDD